MRSPRRGLRHLSHEGKVTEMTGGEVVLAIRPLGANDWGAVAVLLGHEVGYGKRLEAHVVATYSPWIGWIAETTTNQTVGAAISGVRRRVDGGQSRVLELVWVGVSALYRRQGISTSLLARVISDASDAGITRLEAIVDASDTDAVAFFRSAGFEVERQTADMRISPTAAELWGRGQAPPEVAVRSLSLQEVPNLTGLLIHLAVERAVDPHDDLEVLTPTTVASWLRRAGTVSCAAWEADDLSTPVGLAWATRRDRSIVLRFVGVHEDLRRRGIARALLAGLVGQVAGEVLPIEFRVHEPAGLHGFLVNINATVSRNTFTMVRSVTVT